MYHMPESKSIIFVQSLLTLLLLHLDVAASPVVMQHADTDEGTCLRPDLRGGRRGAERPLKVGVGMYPPTASRSWPVWKWKLFSPAGGPTMELAQHDLKKKL